MNDQESAEIGQGIESTIWLIEYVAEGKQSVEIDTGIVSKVIAEIRRLQSVVEGLKGCAELEPLYLRSEYTRPSHGGGGLDWFTCCVYCRKQVVQEVETRAPVPHDPDCVWVEAQKTLGKTDYLKKY